MRLRVHEIRLTDTHVWRSAREAIPVQPGLLVELEADGVSGFGEASAFMADRYNSSLDALHAALRSVAGVLRELPGDNPERAWQMLAPLIDDSPFALAALDTAAHDLAARLSGVPLWRHLGAPGACPLRSSYSIGLDDPAVMVGKLLDRPGWPAYKVKLAAPGDMHILKALRECTDAPFFVDGNCGWEPAASVGALGQMLDLGVALIEQPFPRESWAAARELKAVSPIPVYADESITGPHDLDACAEAFHGVNVKLMKAGGITPTMRMLRRAKAAGLQTMLGCMPESSAGISAIAHLGPFVDHLDIDSIALLAVDTGVGVILDDAGRVIFREAPGTGFVPGFEAPAFTVRPPTPMPGGGDGRELSACRDGRVRATVRLRRQSLPGRPPARGTRQLVGPFGTGTPDGPSADELVALLRTAVTWAVADGADIVWLRPWRSGLTAAACRAAGFRALPGRSAEDGSNLASEGLSPLLVWKAGEIA